MSTVGTTTLRTNGRVRIPAAILQRAGMAEGDNIVAIPNGPGRVILATSQAVTQALGVTPQPTVDSRRLTARDRESEEEMGEKLLRKLGIN